MSRKGGYKIIDLKGVNHTPSVGMLHNDIYDKIESTNKNILISGLVCDGIEYNDFYINFKVTGSSYVGRAILGNTSINITITDTDVVTITIA